ncbi:MAG: sigma-70 family RNA polymerase sigma factor [Spirochaetota bacterium]|nr:sigma-70 family RNA polymerase sigma factor [Spirochaetota bacterium]
MKTYLEEESDEVLMLSFKAGDEQAFEEIVKRYKTKLFNYIYKYISDVERSEEITQEVFIRVYRSRDRYKIKAKFSTFIYRIALNLAFNEVRNRNRRKTDLQNEFDDKIFDDKIKEHNTPEKIYERKEVEIIVNREISNLSSKYKDVILLCDIEGLSYKEVAKILDISIGTVQSRLSRGRVRLKQRLENILNIK